MRLNCHLHAFLRHVGEHLNCALGGIRHRYGLRFGLLGRRQPTQTHGIRARLDLLDEFEHKEGENESFLF